VLDHHAADLAGRPRDWVGYLSTTGVYGDRAGGWVDEETPPAPSGERGRRRVEAERRWLALVDKGVPVHVFRLAGIYGPGRNALETVRAGAGKRIDKPVHRF
jgi:nucleoside-diphosphate-sugar epimerase